MKRSIVERNYINKEKQKKVKMDSKWEGEVNEGDTFDQNNGRAIC